MIFVCPKCERELRKPNQWHSCVKVEIGELFNNKSKEVEFVFDKLFVEIFEWGNISVSATDENAIRFKILFSQCSK